MYLITVAYDDNTIRIRCAETYKILGTLRTNSRTIGQVAASNDSTMLAAACGKTFKLWELGSNEELMSTEQLTEVISVCFNNTGEHVAVGERRGVICIFDTATKEALFKIAGSARAFPTVCYNYTSETVLAATDSPENAIELFESRTGKLTRTVAETSMIWCLCASPVMNFIAYGALDGTVTILNLEDDSKKVLRGHRSQVSCLAFNLDGNRLVSGSSDGTVRIWDTELGTKLTAINMSEPVLSVAYNSDGSRLAVACNTDVAIVDVETSNEVKLLRSEGRSFYSAAALVLM
jgi:WD40 repeat protein